MQFILSPNSRITKSSQVWAPEISGVLTITRRHDTMSKRRKKEKNVDQKGDGTDKQNMGYSPKHQLGYLECLLKYANL